MSQRRSSRRHLFLSVLWMVFAVAGLALVVAFRSQSGQSSKKIQIAAAADLKFVLDEIVKEFEHARPGVDVRVSYASSGSIYAELSNQAPFDIFCSADLSYPHKLKDEGLALDGAVFTYAVGRLVLWAPKPSSIDLEHLGSAALQQPSVRHISIANPTYAPYGRAAEAALRALGFYDSVKDKIVLGENVAQAFQFVQSGAADIGIISLSLALAPDVRNLGKYWQIPPDKYPPLEQGGIILKWARDPSEAREFRAFLLGATARSILKRSGYDLPKE